MGAILGAFCPLPWRLGGDEFTGLTAAQHARICADLTDASRALPFAVITLERASGVGSVATIVRHDTRAAIKEVTITGELPAAVTITWPNAPIDDLGNRRPLRINSFAMFQHDAAGEPSALIAAPNEISIGYDSGLGWRGKLTIKVYATWGDPPRIEDYGGSPDKHDATRETTPYAWIQYQELEAAWGSGYGAERSGSVHSRKLAFGRALGAAYRSEERLRCNSRPDTAEAMLEEWAKSVDVQVPFGEPAWKTRHFCSVMLRAESGQSIPALERSCADLLDDAFVGIRTFDVDDPPGVWPSSWDLGGGVWCSTRAKILVDVKPPVTVGDSAFKDLVQIRLMRALDRLAPAHCWYNWTIPGDGFYLDISPLDYTGL